MQEDARTGDQWQSGLVRELRGLCRVEGSQAQGQVRREAEARKRLWWSMGATQEIIEWDPPAHW